MRRFEVPEQSDELSADEEIEELFKDTLQDITSAIEEGDRAAALEAIEVARSHAERFSDEGKKTDALNQLEQYRQRIYEIE